MGRLTAGMLVAITMLFLAVPASNAAEIPPTAECSSLYGKLTKEFKPKYAKAKRMKEVRKLDKEFFTRLFEADCVSDAKPLIDEMPAKPFSEKCVAASKDASDYFKPISAEVAIIVRAGNKVIKPVRRQLRQVQRKIRNLRKQGASRKRIRPLARKRAALARKQARVTKPFLREMFRVIRTQSNSTQLVVAELASLRCIDLESMFQNKPTGPATKVIRRHLSLIFLTFILTLEDAGKDGAVVASTDPLPTVDPFGPGLPSAGLSLPTYLTPGQG